MRDGWMTGERNWMRRGLKLVVIATLVTAVFGLVGVLVMSLWNALVPGVFGVRMVTFWQAIGLLILMRLLFGGFRGRRGPFMPWRHRMAGGWHDRCGGRGTSNTEPKTATG